MNFKRIQAIVILIIMQSNPQHKMCTSYYSISYHLLDVLRTFLTPLFKIYIKKEQEIFKGL